MYQIEVCDTRMGWTAEGLGEGNIFPTTAAALEAIELLREIDNGSPEWRDAEYRIVEL